LLDSVEAVIQYASTMTLKSSQRVVCLVTTIYQMEVKLTKEAMNLVESQVHRLPSLRKLFVDIDGSSPANRDS
jgi:hypothetical protein